MPKTRKLPDFEVIWARMLKFAEECRRTERPLYTLRKQVKNYITDVKPTSIGRWSEHGRSDDQSRITKGKVKEFWDYLVGEREEYYVLYFIPAFMLVALPEYLEYLGEGEVALRGSPLATETKELNRQYLPQTYGGRGGGESAEHRGIRLAIYERPNELLADIPGGPFTGYATEFQFATGDRADVVLRDAEGNFLLVEVKPYIVDDDLAPYAQVAKYRTLWHILESTPLEAIRCLVAAPELCEKTAKKMRRDQGIESIAVVWAG